MAKVMGGQILTPWGSETQMDFLETWEI